MKFAIDHDGTALLHPEIYKQIIDGLRAAGHEVGIITGRSDEGEYYDKMRLRKLGFKYDFFWNSGMMNEDELDMLEKIRKGELHFDRDTICCHFKMRICEEKGVDVLIDDNADTIRLCQTDGKVLVLKSPTDNNMPIPKWGKHVLVYDD